MASLIICLIVACTWNTVKSDCNSPLGMKTKKIADQQITASHWLHFKEYIHRVHKYRHYVPELARLNLASVSGGWCSESLYDYPDQYIQIDLLHNKKITGLATQGRHGFSEYTEAYQITYERDNENFFRKYSEENVWKEFKGNKDNMTVVRNTLKHPIIARKIRIYPRGSEFSIYCLRLELYGCKWSHRSSNLMTYAAPFGVEVKGVDTRDYVYDGNVSRHGDNRMHGGLGKLTDDIYGKKKINDVGSSPWVAYNVKDPEIVFKFHTNILIKQVMVHVKNNGGVIQIFRHALIMKSIDDQNYTLIKKYTTTQTQENKMGAFAIVIDLEGVLTTYVKIRFVKRSQLLLLSEVLFITDDYPPKKLYPVRGVKNTASTARYITTMRTRSEKSLFKDDSLAKKGGKSKGLSFPIILTITLVTSAIFIILTVIIYKSYVRKHASSNKESLNTMASPKVPSAAEKQSASLLYDPPRVKVSSNTLTHQGIFLQPSMQPYNTKPLLT